MQRRVASFGLLPVPPCAPGLAHCPQPQWASPLASPSQSPRPSQRPSHITKLTRKRNGRNRRRDRRDGPGIPLVFVFGGWHLIAQPAMCLRANIHPGTNKLSQDVFPVQLRSDVRSVTPVLSNRKQRYRLTKTELVKLSNRHSQDKLLKRYKI